VKSGVDIAVLVDDFEHLRLANPIQMISNVETIVQTKCLQIFQLIYKVIYRKIALYEFIKDLFDYLD